MNAGYFQISAAGPNADQAQGALQQAGVDKVFRDENVSGATANRPALVRCLESLQASDTLVVRRLADLAGNVRDLAAIIEQLKKRRVHLLSLKEGLGTSTRSGPVVFQLFHALRQFEHDQMIERTRRGLMAARLRGIRPGPKPELTREQLAEARTLVGEGQSREYIADLLGVSRTTLWRGLV